MIQDNIEFNSVKTSHGTEINSGPLGIRGQVGIDEFGGVINAVDIDWNEADFANASAPSSEPTTINTSGDLVKDIKWASTVGSGSGVDMVKWV